MSRLYGHYRRTCRPTFATFNRHYKWTSYHKINRKQIVLFLFVSCMLTDNYVVQLTDSMVSWWPFLGLMWALFMIPMWDQRINQSLELFILDYE